MNHSSPKVNAADLPHKIEPSLFEEFKKVLSKEQELVFAVRTNSMDPVIKINDIISVGPITYGQIKPFDIILFWRSNALICHYVMHINKLVSVGSRTLVTRGINSGEDFPVLETHILGLVQSHKIPFWYKLKFNLRRLISKRGI